MVEISMEGRRGVALPKKKKKTESLPAQTTLASGESALGLDQSS